MHPAFRAIFAGLLFGAPFAATAGAAQPSCSLSVVAVDDTTMTLSYSPPDDVARTVWVYDRPTTMRPHSTATVARADAFQYPTIGNWISVAETIALCTPPTTTSSTTTSTTAPPSTTTTAVSPTTVTAPTTVVTATTPQPSTTVPPATSTSVELLPPVTVPGVSTTVGLPRLPETGGGQRALIIGAVVTGIGVAGAYAARRIEND